MVNEVAVDVFLELACFFDDLNDVGNSILFHMTTGNNLGSHRICLY